MAQNIFSEQTVLLMKLLPHIAQAECFALKGGTAINLFLRDMPRLSVDIDLAYLPIQDRETSLAAIDAALEKIGADITKHLPDCMVNSALLKGTGKRFKLTVKQGDTVVKVEVTPVLRGSVYPSVMREVTGRARSAFGYVRMQLLSFEDLYAGKLCAALDRQHPRDIFDIMVLLNNEGISTRLKDAFLVYLLGHNRPIVELLDPQLQDMEPSYDSDFSGMTMEPTSLEQLEESRRRIIDEVHHMLTEFDKRFLLSVKKGDADWSSFPIPDAERLPAIQWKLHNLKLMDSARREEALRKLEMVLFGKA